MEDSLKKRYSIKLFTNIISVMVGVVLIAIVPKALGPVAYGQFIYLQGFFMKIIAFLDMGSSTAFFTKLSFNHKRKELITFYFYFSLFVLTLISIFIYIIDVFEYTDKILPNIPNQYIFMGLFFGFITWLTQIFIKISDANALTVSVELIKVGHKIVSMLLLIFFVYQTAFDLNSFFYFNYISLILFLLILIWLFIKKGIFERRMISININFKRLTKEFMEYCSPLVVTTIIAISVGLFDIWLLQKIAGSEQIGFYGLSYSIAAMCFMFTSAMTPIITREFAKSYGQKDLREMKKLFFRYVPMLYSIAAYFSIFISFHSEQVIEIFTDEKFKDAYLVLVLMAFYPIHQTYGQLSGSVLYATGRTKTIRNISLITQPIGLLLSFIFIFYLEFGAVGLVMKMLIVQFLNTLMQLYYNAKFLDFKMNYFIIHQIYTIIFFVLLAYISSNIINFDLSLIDFLVSGFIYTFLVIIFAYIFPQIFATNRSEIKLNIMRLKNVIKKQIKK